MTASHMARALELARRARGSTAENPPVGAVLVRDGKIVGEGKTQPGGRPHAEVEALRAAGSLAAGASLYVTLEPCSHWGRTPPCADALMTAGISSAHIALLDPNPLVNGEGARRLQAHGIEVIVGEGADEAADIAEIHLSSIRNRRPFVTLASHLPPTLVAELRKEHDLTITGSDPVETPNDLPGTVFRLRKTPRSVLVEAAPGAEAPTTLPPIVESGSLPELLTVLGQYGTRAILLIGDMAAEEAFAAERLIDKIVSSEDLPPRSGFAMRRRLADPSPHLELYPTHEEDEADVYRNS